MRCKIAHSSPPPLGRSACRAQRIDTSRPRRHFGRANRVDPLLRLEHCCPTADSSRRACGARASRQRCRIHYHGVNAERHLVKFPITSQEPSSFGRMSRPGPLVDITSSNLTSFLTPYSHHSLVTLTCNVLRTLSRSAVPNGHQPRRSGPLSRSTGTKRGAGRQAFEPEIMQVSILFLGQFASNAGATPSNGQARVSQPHRG